jgi:thioredoxin 1
MEKAKVLLFTSPRCPHCPAAKKFAINFAKTRDDFELIEMSTMTPDGNENAKKYDVMTVPTFIILGNAFPDPIGLRGIQNKETMNKYIDIALGIKTLDETPKKSAIKEFLKKFKL